ncbi:MAG: hypothetical protein MUP70_00165, partial [Candidatus Aminicenantes bacterium]|nr:hypothetical protein [Candidatus Aminicenantes bacterium]
MEQTKKTMNIKLLYIEDDQIDQQAFERLVQKQNLSYEYNMSSGVAEAKALLEENKYDIIISDFQLGDGTAFDLLD